MSIRSGDVSVKVETRDYMVGDFGETRWLPRREACRDAAYETNWRCWRCVGMVVTVWGVVGIVLVTFGMGVWAWVKMLRGTW